MQTSIAYFNILGQKSVCQKGMKTRSGLEAQPLTQKNCQKTVVFSATIVGSLAVGATEALKRCIRNNPQTYFRIQTVGGKSRRQYNSRLGGWGCVFMCDVSPSNDNAQKRKTEFLYFCVSQTEYIHGSENDCSILHTMA